MRAALAVCAVALAPALAAAQTLCPAPAGAIAAGVPVAVTSTPAADSVRCGAGDPLPDLAATSALVAQALAFDFATNPYSLVSAAVQFKENAAKQTLSVSPLKLQRNRTAWDGWSLGLVTGGSTTTLSTGVTYDQAAHYAGRRRGLMEAFVRDAPTAPLREDDETLAAYTARVDTFMAKAYSDYWMRRLRNTNSISLTGSLQTFAGLPGSRVDLDNDGLTDNEYAVKGYGVTAQWMHRLSFWSAATLTLQAGEKRTAATEGSPLRTVYGAGLSASRVVMILDPDYRLSKDYRSRLYVPSIAAGASLEWLKCDAVPLECDDRVVERWTAMPYVDVRLPAGAQFRLGVPVRNERTGDKTGVRIDPLLQFSWSLASL